MNTLEAIINVCTEYKLEKFEIEEFQSRLESVLVSDEYKQMVSKSLLEATNKLEEIRFCELESDFRKYGEVVADVLLNEVDKIGL